jgi:Domain of unknown function (DUF222)/HNH endonuclease
LIKVVEDGGLTDFDDQRLVGFLQGFEGLRNRLPLIDHELIIEADARDLPSTLCQGSLRRVLTSALRVSKAEAARRVRAAEAVGRRRAATGELPPPRRQWLAEAQRAGEVSPEQVAIIERGLDGVDRRGFDADDIDAGEQLLVRHASLFSPEDLRLLTDKVVDAIDPDGTLPQEQLNEDRRNFRMRPTKDGGYTGEFRLTGPAGAKLAALLEALARPRVPGAAAFVGDHAATGDVAASGENQLGPQAHTGERDLRSRGQRMHDALEEVCDQVLRCGDQPQTGGVPVTVVITITLEDLLDRLGYGRTADGTLIPTATVLAMADAAEIIPAVCNRAGAVLDLGRTRRLASQAQTMALSARDAGCSFPGCSVPPQLCERHHIVAWLDGGRTDLDNLTLLCRYHHHNFGRRGWTCRLNLDRLPEWSPPAWVDPDQRAMINTRISAQTVSRKLKRRRPSRN